VMCGNCQTLLCTPTGGKAKLTEGCSFRKKWDWRRRYDSIPFTHPQIFFSFIMNFCWYLS
jgi:hypothetical protein